MKQITLELERVGRLVVALSVAEAPANCAALEAMLPLKLCMRHSMFSGEALEGRIPGLGAVPENPRWFGIQPGTLGLEVPAPGQPADGLGLVLVYGPMFQFRTAFAPTGAPLYVVGQVVEGLSSLQAGGSRFLDEGEGMLSLTGGTADG